MTSVPNSDHECILNELSKFPNNKDNRMKKIESELLLSPQTTTPPSSGTERPTSVSSHSLAIKIANDTNTMVVVPPDGGWGWMVVFASFMCNLIVDGIIFSFGAFLPDIAFEFQVSKAPVTLVGSLMSGFYLIAGPFASAVANIYGFRSVAIFGTILTAVAFILSYFAFSVEYLCITYGVLGGIGFGFVYVPSILTVGFYFERWRALATGIAVCGSGVGTFLFAPLSEWLIEKLGWRHALLIQSILILTCVFYAALFRPLKPTRIETTKKAKELIEIHPSGYNIKLTKQAEAMNGQYDHIADYDVYHTIHHIPSHGISISSKAIKRELSVPLIINSVKADNNNEAPQSDKPHFWYRNSLSQSLTALPQYGLSQTIIPYDLGITIDEKADVEAEKEVHSRSKKRNTFVYRIQKTLLTLLDFKLLKSPSFLILAIGGFFTMMGFYVPFMFLVDRALKNNMEKQMAVLLISSIGIANTIGRVLCGVLSSFPGINALLVTNIALTLGGSATIFSGFSSTKEYQFTYAAIFGLSTSCFASLRSTVVVDLLGLEHLTNAFGLLLLFQGVAAIIGAPLAGAFMDATGSYDASFYLSGSMILISAIMCYPLNWINKWEINRNLKVLNENNI